MKDIISISDEAATQIKKILSASKQDVNGIIVGVDKTGCSGYAYKIDYANKDMLSEDAKLALDIF